MQKDQRRTAGNSVIEPLSGQEDNRSERNERRNSANAGKWLGILLVVLVAGLSLRFLLDWRSNARVESLAQQTKAASRAGDWSRAEVLARQWAAMRPDAVEPWQYSADVALELNDPVAAVKYLEQMPEGAPLDSYLQLGYLQMEALQDPLATERTCDKTLKHYPDDSETHERLLYFYTMTCQRNEVSKEAKRAIEIGSDTLATYAYLFAAKWLTFTNGYEQNQRWLETHPNNELFEVAAVLQMPSFQYLDVLARERVEPGAEPRPLEYASARVSELREKYPENLELLAIETRNLSRSGDVSKVANLLALQLPGMANDNRFWRFKGWYHSMHEQWTEALDAYGKALEIEPFDWATQLEIAAAIRATEGVKASVEMQARADTGKRLMMAVQKCPKLYELEPPTIYDDMESYFRECGEDKVAAQLRKRLDARR